MNRITIFLMIGILLGSSVIAVQYSDAPRLKVTLLSQSPDPAAPGEVVTVKFKIENEGKETSDDAIISIKANYPFSLYEDKAEKNIGKLRTDTTGADAVIVEYKLKVDETAVQQDTEVELEILLGGAGVAFTKDNFLVHIRTQDPVLDITSIGVTPDSVPPGGTAELKITVKNLADSLLKDIKFTLNFKDSSFPLAPYQTSSQRRVPQLQPNNQLPLTFTVIASPDATPGLYKIPVNVTYNDEKGNSYLYSDVVAILVGDTPSVKAYVKKSTIQQAGEQGVVTLEIANAGATDVKFLELALLPTEEYELLSTSNYIYVGDVDSDDTESEEFSLYVKSSVDDLVLPVVLKYADANNKPFQQRFDLRLHLYSSWDLRTFGVIESNYGWIVVLLLILGGGYWYYTRYYKKKKPLFRK